MNRIKVHDKYFVPYIPNSEIQDAIQKVADRINADFEGRNEVPVVLVTLNGAIVFAGELLTKLNFELEISGIKVQSYQGTSSTGNIKEVLGLTTDVEGRSVIIIEDIVDTGTTILKLCDNLQYRKAKDIRVCTLFYKPEVYTKDRRLDYVGMAIENRFIVGHGLDYNQLGRNLADVYILENQLT